MAFAKSEQKKIAIIGAAGYGGMQLVRLLKDHPAFEITYISGHSRVGKKWNDLL